jgi:hypothetical protein
MGKKSRYIGIALIIAIFIGLGVISYIILDEDEGEVDLWGGGSCIIDPGPSVYKLHISDEGYAELMIGPFVNSEGDGLPGINVTIHLKNNNISALTGTTGYAIFYLKIATRTPVPLGSG